MVAKLQYGGSFGSTETQTVSIRIIDEINHPKFLEVEVANPDGNRRTTYSPFDEVRIIEDDLQGDPVLFRGKIEKVSTPTHPRFGQMVHFTARDNLQELAYITVEDGDYGQNGRDAVICDLVRSHIKTIGATGITVPAVGSNTTAFESSLDTGGVSYDVRKSHKRLLRCMQELAAADPWSSAAASTENTGFYFYLDDSNNLHYRRVGTTPSIPLSNGFACIYGLAAETTSRKQMLPGSSWDELAQDVVTEVDVVAYVNRKERVTRFQRFTHGTVGGSGYPFHADDEILGVTNGGVSGSGSVAKIQLVTSGAIIVTNVDDTGPNDVPDFTAGETIIVTKVDRNSDGAYSNGAGTGGSDDEIGHASSSPAYRYSVASGAGGHGTSAYDTTAGGSATFTTTPHMELGFRKRATVSHPDLHVTGDETAAQDRLVRQESVNIANQVLREGFIDVSANTMLKASVGCVGFPSYSYGGADYSIVRAGDMIYVQNTTTTSVSDNMHVSRLEFVQGNGSYQTTLNVSNSNGNLWLRGPSAVAKKAADDSATDTIQVLGREQVYHTPVSTAAPNIPQETYGIFQYNKDGGGASTSTLGFLSGQTVSTPAAATAESAFWSMLSESDGSTGSNLIFEPIVDYDSTDTTKNRAFIGYHNPLFAIYGYYLNAGVGNAAFPSHSFYGDTNTGMFLNSSDNIGFSLGGTMRFGMTASTFYPALTNSYDLGYNDGGGGTDFDFRNIYSVNALSVSSDRRLKEDIQPTNLGLSFLNDLTPVSYKWKEKHDGVMDQRHYGLIAQDVVAVLKDHGIDSLEDFGGILHNGNEEQMYKAKYTHFIPILIKAVQELSDEVRELKEKN